jgi:hypothetical protein
MTTTTETPVIVKVYLPNSEIRRFKIINKTFKEFFNLVQLDLLNEILAMSYYDDKGEWVTFSSEREWTEALQIPSKILRVRVSLAPCNGKKILYRHEQYAKYCRNFSKEMKDLPSDLFSVQVK